MRNILKKINETGTLLVEAMAMLGLITMVTPVLYKKAAERTVELQDVNASSHLRALSTAVDAYLKDNFSAIVNGERVTDSNGWYDYGDLTEDEPAEVSMEHFADYLQEGFFDGNQLRDTKLFNDYTVIIVKSEDRDEGASDARSQVLTGFVVAKAKNANDIDEKRAARIASMVGSNGGYIRNEGDTAQGTQGIWQVDTGELGLRNDFKVDGTMVVSSLQPITSQGLTNEELLHRKVKPLDDYKLNTMETDLFMGFDGNHHNIRMVNQIIMMPSLNNMVGAASPRGNETGEEPNLDNALYIGNNGGANISGTLQAIGKKFKVSEDYGIQYGDMANPTFEVNSDRMTFNNDNSEFQINNDGLLFKNIAPGSTQRMELLNAKAGNEPEVAIADSTLRLKMTGDGSWYTIIGGDGVHYGTFTRYNWDDGVPQKVGNDVDGNYDLSVNGSAFVKDTLLTGKIKTFDADFATLRAGVEPGYFNMASDSDFFMKVKAGDDDGAFAKEFKLEDDGEPIIWVRTAPGNSDAQEHGGVVSGVKINFNRGNTDTPPQTDINGGINITAGYTSLPQKKSNYAISHAANTGAHVITGVEYPQLNAVKVGAREGVYISAFDSSGYVTNAPVSIQGNMFKAYGNKVRKGTRFINEFILEENVDNSTIRSMREFLANGNNREMGERMINDMHVSVNTWFDGETTRTPVFQVTPDLHNVNGYLGQDSKEETVQVVGRVAVYDYDYNKGNGAWVKDDAGTYINGQSRPTFEVAKGKIIVRESQQKTEDKWTKTNQDILIVDGNGVVDKPLDLSEPEKRGSVYIRKGAINLATNRKGEHDVSVRFANREIDDMQKGGTNDAVGYIAADRFIAHYHDDGGKVESLLEGNAGVGFGIGAPGNGSRNDNVVGYDHYEVNPAYTSVMHDIKLTTRGGARLSDILPDFINKGIYVVDNTFKAGSIDWSEGTDKGAVPTHMQIAEVGEETSPYLGFVPTPKCPPGYAKVITLTPASWAMAQAGLPIRSDDKLDIRTPTNIGNYEQARDNGEDTTSFVLRFQKNTWLKSMVRPFYGQGGGGFNPPTNPEAEKFQGWGTVMGFIYPASHYQELNSVFDTSGSNESLVYWNLFPVYTKELEGYATVYCYFDRSGLNKSLVDADYDQLSAAVGDSVNSYIKGDQGQGSEYLDRLNDPKLKYNSPW